MTAKAIAVGLPTLPKKLVIVIAQVDPDAVGAALGLQAVLHSLKIDALIQYCGRIGHPQNEALFNRFDLGSKIAAFNLEPGYEVALVDSNRGKDSRIPELLDPVLIIDHHQDSDLLPGGRLMWLDTSVGSASTMVVELIREVENVGVDMITATALALGIYTDTKNMMRASERDQQAYLDMRVLSDGLSTLINYTRPFSFLLTLAKAVAQVKELGTFKEGRMLAGLGRLPANCGDDLAMIADEFLRTTGCTLAVTWAVIDDSVRVCARSNDLTLNLSEFLKERFGGKCGAKVLPDGAGEGGALIQLETNDWIAQEELIEIVSRRIREWMFA